MLFRILTGADVTVPNPRPNEIHIEYCNSGSVANVKVIAEMLRESVDGRNVNGLEGVDSGRENLNFFGSITIDFEFVECGGAM